MQFYANISCCEPLYFIPGQTPGIAVLGGARNEFFLLCNVEPLSKTYSHFTKQMANFIAGERVCLTSQLRASRSDVIGAWPQYVSNVLTHRLTADAVMTFPDAAFMLLGPLQCLWIFGPLPTFGKSHCTCVWVEKLKLVILEQDRADELLNLCLLQIEFFSLVSKTNIQPLVVHSIAPLLTPTLQVSILKF